MHTLAFALTDIMSHCTKKPLMLGKSKRPNQPRQRKHLAHCSQGFWQAAPIRRSWTSGRVDEWTSGPPIDSSSGLGLVSRAGTLQAYDSLFQCRSNDDAAPVVLPLLGNPHFPASCGVFGWAAHEPRRKVSFRREKQALTSRLELALARMCFARPSQRFNKVRRFAGTRASFWSAGLGHACGLAGMNGRARNILKQLLG